MQLDYIELFDTTLRDGTQGEGINLSVKDKVIITQKLDEFGIDIIEGGWPGSNPRDEEFFKEIKKVKLYKSSVCAFGSTARFPDKVISDGNLNALLKAETPFVSIFGKTWNFHSEIGLGFTENENEDLIYNSVKYLAENGRRVVFFAEQIFDGYKTNRAFALKMLKAAEKGGAEKIVLCDTNGGSIPGEIFDIVKDVLNNVSLPVGIHAHNDSDLAVANSLVAVQAGAVHVQGTINGVGERCGNANLCSIIPNIILKMNMKTRLPLDLGNLTGLSNFVYEVMNLNPNTRAAFVGKSAFAHKGGIHVSAVLKDSKMYEHIEPEKVGNQQRVLVSDLSGQSNIRYKAKELGIDLSQDNELSKRVVSSIKTLEYEGFQFEGAEASFELILRTEMNEYAPHYKLLDAKVNVVFGDHGYTFSEAIMKVEVDGEIEHTASNGDGPVNALDNALRKALLRFYPEIASIKLIDYKVRVLNDKKGTNAKVRVLIESSDGCDTWSTVGVSENIIQASWQALNDSINYKLYKIRKKESVSN